VSFSVPNQLLDDLTVNPPTGDIPKPPITKPPPGD